MNKIKMSFTKVLPFAVVFCFVLMITGNIAERLSNMIAANMDIINVAGSVWTGIMLFLKAAVSAAFSPLYIGFYKFCFERAGGGKPHILTAFDFYRSAAGFVKSAAAHLISLAAADFSMRMFSNLVMFSIFASRDENTGALFVAAVIALVILVLSEPFFLTPYAYAENSSDGLAAAIKKSVKRGFKFMIVLILLKAADMGINALVLTFYKDDIYNMVRAGKAVVYAADFFNFILILIPYSIMLWIKFTAAYMILGVSPKEQNSAAETAEDAESDEEKPFIEPYDFCIEADERFHDEKVIETENIRGVDILAALEEMNLAFDVVNHFGIRRKLKRMFDDLAFDIGEYVSYEGGKTAENEFTEEIDDRVFSVSVKISRNSDHEPFILNIRINLEEE